MVTVLSVGGSIVAPDKPDFDFLDKFSKTIRNWLLQDSSRKIIMVIGGGAPARDYQNAYRKVCDLRKAPAKNDEADWIGIMATRLNAQLVKAVFEDLCPNPVVYDPTTVDMFGGQILVAAGWKPGFSTDNDAVVLAERFSGNLVVNLSNIAKVYTDDPKKNPEARPIDSISWEDFIKIVGTEWVPGKNTPFDPIASQRAQKAGIKVICAAGKDIENLENILNGKDFKGTVIG
ncbi:putative uridylate kinase [Treponema denticola MYR-T]|uniref:Uridylate kinase n=5 Tax=Treponema denticola TaxID=158 RepID=Q73KY2_TREDE|nr:MULTISPECIES: UMP kinase [Treponema]AAS12605.1 amino acid kinase family protein [Treponema denticola ATCC 35405]AFD04835.1 uridylate kinase [Treponema denticola]AFD04836.1 uridylate kinase [Treponema denticola]AFD04839.1 uridylate kinase [Treponema denticola OTK]AFD04844.1 uridylate kinase [Treponema denticola]